jgi:hypothetical protein
VVQHSTENPHRVQVRARRASIEDAHDAARGVPDDRQTEHVPRVGGGIDGDDAPGAEAASDGDGQAVDEAAVQQLVAVARHGREHERDRAACHDRIDDRSVADDDVLAGRHAAADDD